MTQALDSSSAQAQAARLLALIARSDTSDQTVLAAVVAAGDAAGDMLEALVVEQGHALASPAISDVHREALWDAACGMDKLALLGPLLVACGAGETVAANIISTTTLLDPLVRRTVLEHGRDAKWNENFAGTKIRSMIFKLVSGQALEWLGALSDFLVAYPKQANSSNMNIALRDAAEQRSKLGSQGGEIERLDLVLDTFVAHGADPEALTHGSFLYETQAGPRGRRRLQHHGVLHYALFEAQRDTTGKPWGEVIDLLIRRGSPWKGLLYGGVLDEAQRALLLQRPRVRKALLEGTLDGAMLARTATRHAKF